MRLVAAVWRCGVGVVVLRQSRTEASQILSHVCATAPSQAPFRMQRVALPSHATH